MGKAIEQLRRSIGTFRDAINADADFAVHKTLVGFQSVFPPDWERDNIVGTLSHPYREAKMKEYVSQISDATADYWLRMIRRCAATRSDDGATFMTFSQFLEQISSAHPAFMLRLLDEAPADIIGFLTPIMNGLKTSTAASAAMERLKAWIDNGQHNREVVFYLRFAKGTDPALVRTVAKNALATKDDIAALYVIAAIIARDDLHNAASLDAALIPCLNLLTERQDARWVDQAWFQPPVKTFFASLSPAHAQAVLQNLVFCKTVDYHIEPIIVALSQADYAGVWDLFRQRFEREDASSSQDRYDAIPFQFSEAQKGLAADPAQAVDLVRSWHRDDDHLFEFKGGRLLSITFPGMPDAFRDKLISIVEVEGASAFSFVRSILSNYRGEVAVHPICQALVENLPDDDERLGSIDTLLSGTGVVTGPFGFVEAYRGKKAAITPWLDDARPKVRAFAQSYIKGIDLRITSEQRSAEQQHVIRKLDWSDPEAD